MKPLHTQIRKIPSFLYLGILFTLPLKSKGQYCAPVITNGGLYINMIDFSNSTVTGGIQHYTGVNNGYTPATATTSGTVSRYFGFSFVYSIGNPTESKQSYDFAFYGDWNNDGDFDDAGEQQSYPLKGAFDPGSLTTGNTSSAPLAITPGNYRLRFAVKQDSSGIASACGTYIGEVEDYIITVRANTAPVLNIGASPTMNTLLSSQTSSNGMAISEIVGSTEPGAFLATDADDQGPIFYSKVPRGLAIYGQTATNGTWQYKVGAGTWTDFGSISMTNALLLLGDGGLVAYKSGTRIRFVPTGVGTPSISFKAWDGTSGINGSYSDATATGGTSAFSNANSSASLAVVNPGGYGDNIYFSSFNNAVYKGFINRPTKSFTNTDPILQNSPDYYSSDIDRDPNTNKIYWITGQGPYKVAASSADGTSVQTSLISGLTYCTGLAIGNSKIYYWDWSEDYSTASLFKANIDGTGAVSLLTDAYQYTQDIEFYKNKLYFEYSTDYINFNIASIDTTAAGFTVLYSGTNNFGGLAVAKDTLYWTEADGTLKKKAIAGGSVTQLASESTRVLSDLVVDSVSSTIYFLDNDLNSNDRYTTVRRVATNGGSVTTAGTLTGLSSSMTFNTSALSALPVSLLNFAGRYNKESFASILTWETASEENNSKFILERSTDGIRFSEVASVKGAGTSPVVHRYQYSDNVKNIDAGTIYYRLQQVDADGRSSYSNVIALEKSAGAILINIWPNPAKGYFNIHLGNLSAAPVTISVYSYDGKLIIKDLISKQDFQLNLSNRQAGIYYLKLAFSNGIQKQFTIVNQVY